MIEYINHVTLNTGDYRRSNRSEIDKEIFFKLNNIYKDSFQNKNGTELEIYGKLYRVKTTLTETCGITTLYRILPNKMEIPIITTGYSDIDYQVFDMIKETMPKLNNIEVLRPKLPYIVDKIEMGSVLDIAAMQWTGDFTRCIGWLAIAGVEVAK